MKKLQLLFSFLILISLIGCSKTPQQYKNFQKFENSKACFFEVGVVADGSYTFIMECVSKNNLVEIQFDSQKNAKFIYDTKNNKEYYNGVYNNYCICVDPFTTTNVVSMLDYMEDITYSKSGKTSCMFAKFDFNKMSTNILGYEFIDIDGDFKEFFTDCYIGVDIINNLVKEIRIYPNYGESKNVYLKYIVFEYGNTISKDIVLKDDYTSLKTVEAFVQKIEEDLSSTENPNLEPTYSMFVRKQPILLEIDTEEYYFEVNFYKNGYYLTEKYLGLDSLSGDFNLKKPGEYEVTISTSIYGVDVNYTFTINVIDKQITTSNDECSIIANTKAQFSFDNYFVANIDNFLYLYNLDNLPRHRIFDIKCNYSSYYVKDNYLYVASYEDYDYYTYNYGNDEDFSGYITKINLDTLKIDKQVKVNRFISNILVDKYDKIIITKGQNGFSTLELFDMTNETFTTLIGDFFHSSESTCGVLVYDELTESIIHINTTSTGKPSVYKYDHSIKNYKYFNELEDLRGPYLCNFVNDRYNNKALLGEYYYDFSNNTVIYQKMFNIVDRSYGFTTSEYGTISEQYVIVGKAHYNGYILGILDNKTKTQINLVVEDLVCDGKTITNIHYYNGKIYLFNSQTNKLISVNY